MTEPSVSVAQTIAVDFDGVLHTYERGWADGSIYGSWMPGAVAGLSLLMQRYAVFVHTTRNPRQVAQWIERQSGYAFECVTRPAPWPWRRTFWSTQGLLLVTRQKFPAVAYIDDRAVRFTTWDAALREVLPRVGES